VAAVGLLGVVPAAAFLADRAEITASVLAAVSVVLIVASLAYMFSPADAGDPAP
jgi:hypothetical protein